MSPQPVTDLNDMKIILAVIGASVVMAAHAQSGSSYIIKQRAKELADAQSAMTQLQALRQARVLQMLTPEQRVKRREIRQRNQALRRQQQAPNGLDQRQQLRIH